MKKKEVIKTQPRIEVHVSESRAKEGQAILNTMICNLEKWEAGREELRWKFGEHISNNVTLVIDRSMLDD